MIKFERSYQEIQHAIGLYYRNSLGLWVDISSWDFLRQELVIGSSVVGLSHSFHKVSCDTVYQLRNNLKQIQV